MYKICHITTAHTRYDDRVFRKECCSLAKKYETHLIVNDLLDDELVENVHIHSIKASISRRGERFILLKKYYNIALSINADVYHIHDPELLLIAKKIKKTGKKVIFDSHEDYYYQISSKPYLPIGIRHFIARMYHIYETRICKYIDAVIFPTTIDGENPFENRYNNFAYINNYPVKLNNNIDRSYDNRGKVVCYTGSLSESRGILELMDACNACGAKLILAGKFSSDLFERKMKMKKSFQCVDYRGVVSFDEVINIYRESTVGAALLKDVGQYYKLGNLSTKVYEYFQQGLPVINSDYPYAKNCIKKYPFGILVNPESIEDIVNAINKICDNNAMAEYYGKSGMKAYQNEFNWEHEEKKLFDLYNRVL